MAKITRKEAREVLLALLFETEFKCGDDPVSVYELACEDREIPQDKYIRESFFGIISKSEILDEVIGKYSKGWRADRLSKISRTVIRIAVYEMLFVEDIPSNVSISQAVELSLKYGEDKAKQFVNGVLSSLFKDIEIKGIDGIIDEAAKSLENKKTEQSVQVVEEADEATQGTDGENV